MIATSNPFSPDHLSHIYVHRNWEDKMLSFLNVLCLQWMPSANCSIVKVFWLDLIRRPGLISLKEEKPC